MQALAGAAGEQQRGKGNQGQEPGAGSPQAQAFALQPTAQPVRLQLADRPLQEAHDEWVRHKTTRRAHYAAFAPAPGLFDTVLYNEAGEITESSNQMRQLNEETITLALQPLLAPLSEKYAENAAVCAYLQAMQEGADPATIFTRFNQFQLLCALRDDQLTPEQLAGRPYLRDLLEVL